MSHNRNINNNKPVVDQQPQPKQQPLEQKVDDNVVFQQKNAALLNQGNKRTDTVRETPVQQKEPIQQQKEPVQQQQQQKEQVQQKEQPKQQVQQPKQQQQQKQQLNEKNKAVRIEPKTSTRHLIQREPHYHLLHPAQTTREGMGRKLHFLLNTDHIATDYNADQQQALHHLNGRVLTRDPKTQHFRWSTPSANCLKQNVLQDCTDTMSCAKNRACCDTPEHCKQYWNKNINPQITTFGGRRGLTPVLSKITPNEKLFRQTRARAYKICRIVCDSYQALLTHCDKVDKKENQCTDQDVAEFLTMLLQKWHNITPLTTYLCQDYRAPYVYWDNAQLVHFLCFRDILNYNIKNHFNNLQGAQEFCKNHRYTSCSQRFDIQHFIKCNVDKDNKCQTWSDRQQLKLLSQRFKQNNDNQKKPVHFRAIDAIRPIDRWLCDISTTCCDGTPCTDANNKKWDIRQDKTKFATDLVNCKNRLKLGAAKQFVTRLFSASQRDVFKPEYLQQRERCANLHNLRCDIQRRTTPQWYRFFTSESFRNKLTKSDRILRSLNHVIREFNETIRNFILPHSVARAFIVHRQFIKPQRKHQQHQQHQQHQNQKDKQDVLKNWCVTDSKGRKVNKVITPQMLQQQHRNLRHVDNWNWMNLLQLPWVGRMITQQQRQALLNNGQQQQGLLDRIFNKIFN